MPNVSPFRACRAIPQYVEVFSASAYDPAVQNEDYSHVSNAELSYLRILKPGKFSDLSLKPEQIFEISRSNLREIVQQGILIQDETESIYVYRQIKDNHVYTGIIGLVPIEDYRLGHIKRHEKTRVDREEEIVDYLNEVRLSGSPVLLTYRENAHLEEIIQEIVEPAPLYHFLTKANTEHMLWRLEDKDKIDSINSYLKDIKDFYIADGHHRCAAYSEVKDNPPQGFMACLIPSNQLYIQSFYRLIKGIIGFNKQAFIQRLEDIFEIEVMENNCSPAAPGIIHMIIENECYSLKIPETYKMAENPRARLDVSILENLVLKNILNIVDTRTSENVVFVNGSESVENISGMFKKQNIQVAFALYPLSMNDVIEISDRGETMPPKSTWIEPKLRSGLVIHSF